MVLAGVLLRIAARRIPGFADRFASRVNPLVLPIWGRFFGTVPFSVAEVLLCALLGYLLYVLGRTAAACLSLRGEGPGPWLKERASVHAGRIFLLVSAGFLIFEVNEDVYFSRTRFAALYGMERDSYSNEELTEVCAGLVEEINRLAPLVERNDAGIMQVSEGLRDRIRGAMGELGERYPELSGFCPRPKPVFFSRILSRCDITGIYSMFTAEANYNRDMPPYNLPFTMGHELAHLKGFESEKEANFLGYLCCTGTEAAGNEDLLYSGAMLGWVYCGNELYKRDRTAWRRLSEAICHEAARDLEDNNRYWDRYKGKASETMNDVNDAFLKMEGLKEGIASYDLVTDMIVTYEMVRKGGGAGQ